MQFVISSIKLKNKGDFTLKKAVSVFMCIIIVFFASACAKSRTDKALFTRGGVINNVYESDFAGLKFSPGPSWSFASDDEILSENGINKGNMAEEEINERLNELNTVYDMIAEYGASGIKVIILFENCKNSVVTGAISIEDYIIKLKDDLEANYAAYDSSVAIEHDETIGGADYKCVEAVISRESGKVEQIYYVREVEGFFMSLCITVPAETDVAADILSKFDPSCE